MKKRFELLDIIRGANLISMMLYHMTWDLVFLFGVKISWYEKISGEIWQQIICILFIVLSGFCFSLGRKKLKRGIKVFLAGMIVTLVTLISMPKDAVWFGILTFLGSAMILSVPLQKFLKKINPIFGFILSVVLFVLIENINSGEIIFGMVKLPRFLYTNYFSSFFAFPFPSFSSSDYFSFFPWYFLFLSGLFIFEIFKKYDLFYILHTRRCKPLEFVGRHSLIIYMLHQPLIYAILSLIMR